MRITKYRKEISPARDEKFFFFNSEILITQNPPKGGLEIYSQGVKQYPTRVKKVPCREQRSPLKKKTQKDKPSVARDVAGAATSTVYLSEDATLGSQQIKPS